MEVLDEETKESGTGCSGEQRLTLLETFSHQVAGHGAIIKAKGDKICKPLVRRELWFYRDLARSGRTLLSAFVPRWFGCFHISKDALLEVVRMTAAQREEEGEPLHNQQQHHEVVTWSEKVYHDLEHHLTAEPPGQVHHYIVLEDLTAVYRRPCLLDIKMGVRQWGDDATPKKIEYEKFKAETTTTCTLGLRVCGMKVFDAAQGAYAERNKEEGKKVTKDNIVPYLASFFNNGRGVRAGALRGIKQKLEDLRTALRKEGALRLYSTSLLLLYEGDQPEQQSETDADVRCDVRLIDFAHVYPLDEGVENDDGYMWGLDNLINIMEQI